ncbi:MAG: TolC family protein [Bryobacteraceae bacterium]|jgi:outer membrane protein TolC
MRQFAVVLLPMLAFAQEAPLRLDLHAALERARAWNLAWQTALTGAALAHEDTVQAKAALYPTLNYFNQYIYTQGNGTPTGIFVASDGVHVYNSWGDVHEDFSLAKRADYKLALAAEAAARAKQEIGARGLAATVVQNYYGVVTATRRLSSARQSLAEAERFLDITRKQESGGEVAHADAVKAELQVEQRRRELQDAEANREKARLGLGVLLFPDIEQAFDLVDDLDDPVPLMPLAEFRAQALARSPDVRVADAAVAQEKWALAAARSGYYPTLSVDYFYGIDANQWAAEDREGHRLLGSSGQASLTIPVWNWGATRSRVRQAELRQRQAELEATVTRRQLTAGINSAWLEADTARAQADSLRRSVELSRESLRLTLLRYQAGEATALEVVDAQSTLVQARNAWDDGLVRYRVALAGVQTMAGTL